MILTVHLFFKVSVSAADVLVAKGRRVCADGERWLRGQRYAHSPFSVPKRVDFNLFSGDYYVKVVFSNGADEYSCTEAYFSLQAAM